MVFHFSDNSLKVLVSSVAVPRRDFYAIFATSVPVHVSISSRCELVRCNDDSKTPKHEARQPKKEAAKQIQTFAAVSSAKTLAKLGIPLNNHFLGTSQKTSKKTPCCVKTSSMELEPFGRQLWHPRKPCFKLSFSEIIYSIQTWCPSTALQFLSLTLQSHLL